MTEDLRPIPRLPLDTARVNSFTSSNLDAIIVDEPGEPVAQTSLIETRTETRYAPVYYCQIYHALVVKVQETVADAETEAAVVMARFDNGNPVPPQSGR